MMSKKKAASAVTAALSKSNSSSNKRSKQNLQKLQTDLSDDGAVAECRDQDDWDGGVTIASPPRKKSRRMVHWERWEKLLSLAYKGKKDCTWRILYRVAWATKSSQLDMRESSTSLFPDSLKRS